METFKLFFEILVFVIVFLLVSVRIEQKLPAVLYFPNNLFLTKIHKCVNIHVCLYVAWKTWQIWINFDCSHVRPSAIHKKKSRNIHESQVKVLNKIGSNNTNNDNKYYYYYNSRRNERFAMLNLVYIYLELGMPRQDIERNCCSIVCHPNNKIILQIMYIKVHVLSAVVKFCWPMLYLRDTATFHLFPYVNTGVK